MFNHEYKLKNFRNCSKLKSGSWKDLPSLEFSTQLNNETKYCRKLFFS